MEYYVAFKKKEILPNLINMDESKRQNAKPLHIQTMSLTYHSNPTIIKILSHFPFFLLLKYLKYMKMKYAEANFKYYSISSLSTSICGSKTMNIFLQKLKDT